MNKLEVTLEIVTPLFLGGADPRGEPELRAPSFRGALRFWLRALLGGVLGNDPKRIFEEESKVFGSTKQASPVIVYVQANGNLRKKAFSLLLHNKPNVQVIGFNPGQKFKIYFTSHDKEALKRAQKALQLLCCLGGLGRRSRRGFGSLQIVEGDMAVKAQNPSMLADILGQCLRKMLPEKDAEMNSVPDFPTLHCQWSQVIVCKKEFQNWNEAIELVMKKAQKYRNAALGEAEPRQASPVHAHVTKLTSDKYALVLTTMLSEINPKLCSRANREKLAQFLSCFDGEIVVGV